MLKALIPASLALGAVACTQAPAPTYTAKGPIEAKYQARGPWAVTRTISASSCDRENRMCDIWYPTELGSNPLKKMSEGFKHPVISWANGSGEQPGTYSYFLQHLASWGFIVVASRDDGPGEGGTAVDAAQYIINKSNAASSIFYNNVDIANIGAVGHSQGGASVTNLHARKNPLFKTFIALHTSPGWFAQLCCDVQPETYDGSGVTRSIFQWTSTPDSGRPHWYDPVPAPALKAYAALTYARHGDVGQGVGIDCANSRCAQGVRPYLGYSTAWLMWQLQGARDGGDAFKQNGEFLLPDTDWTAALSNVP